MRATVEGFDPLRVSLPTTLESERLLLRCYTLEDAAVLSHALKVNYGRLKDDFPTRMKVSNSTRDVEAFIWQTVQRWDAREEFRFSIWEKETMMFAGEVALKDIAWQIPKGDLGYFVVREFEGKGIITEAVRLVLPFAFEMLALRKLQVRCAAENVRSQRVGERCGFKVEGVLRNDFVIADGRTLIDLVYSGMTDSDYRTLRVKPPVVGGFR